MRVTFLSVSGEMGGSEVSLLELVRGLRRLAPSWRLDVVVPREGPLAAAARACGAAVHVLPLPAAAGAARRSLGPRPGRCRSVEARRWCMAAGSVGPYSRRLARLLAELAPDVIHTNGFKLHVLAARVAPPSAALVWHIHEYVAGRPISRALLRRYASRCAAHRGQLAQRRAPTSRSVLGDAAPVTRIYNAVDPRRVLARRRRARPRRAGRPAGRRARDGARRPGRDVRPLERAHRRFSTAVRRVSPPRRAARYIIGGALYDTAGSQYTRAELEAADRRGRPRGPRRPDRIRRASRCRDARARRRGPREHAAGAVRPGHRRRHGDAAAP